MLNDTFYIDGVNARDLGIYLQREIEFSAPIPNVEKQSVIGRNGDILFESGTYANRTATAICFCLDKDVQNSLNEVNTFLFKKNGYRRLEIQSDPDHFWLARIKNGAQITQRANLLAPFSIVFDCKPQKFLRSGEELFSFSHESTLFNKTWNIAKPLIVVHGYGEGNLQIGDIYVRLDKINGSVILDCESQNAYNGDGNQNENIYAPEFPILKGGLNNIYFDGDISKIDIYPRWWDL